MANDRLMMKCRECGETTMLAKYYPSGGGVWNRDKVCDFVDKHMDECVPSGFDLDGNRVFDLYTENTTSQEAAAKIGIVSAISNLLKP